MSYLFFRINQEELRINVDYLPFKKELQLIIKEYWIMKEDLNVYNVPRKFLDNMTNYLTA